MDFKKNISEYLEKEISILKKLDMEEVNDAFQVILAAWQREATIYVFGNGGSAATASHFVCDFNKGASSYLQKKFRFVCLSDNTPIVTAIANDISYDDVFQYQLEGVLQPDDLVIAVSGSGNSKNIIRAIDYAKSIGTKIVGVTGYNGGELRKKADFFLHAPVDDMQVAEDIHMIYDHMMMRVFAENAKEIQS